MFYPKLFHDNRLFWYIFLFETLNIINKIQFKNITVLQLKIKKWSINNELIQIKKNHGFRK